MSASVRAQADDRNIELGSATNWRLIVAAAGLGLVVLIAIVVLGLAAAAAPRQEPMVQTTVVPAPDLDSLLPPPPKTKTQPGETQPESTVVVALSKPAWPQKPKVLPKPAIMVSEPVPAPARAVEAIPKPAQVAQATPVATFKRRQLYSEENLYERLEKESQELDVEAEKGTTAKLLKNEFSKKKETQAAEKDASKPEARTPPILELMAKRADLKGLLVRNAADCQVPEKEARSMQKFSAAVRAVTVQKLSKGDTEGYRMMFHREAALVDHLEKKFDSPELREDVSVRLLVQMLQADNPGVRLKMVKLWASTKGKTAGAALAQRAVFDLDPDVRRAAILALKDRPTTDYRSILLDGLRYPWSAVADNSAEAFVALNDQTVVPDLVNLLDKPDPQAPHRNKDDKWVVAELVRVNHLGNCVLCHAPCSAKENTVRGVVPTRGQPLPRAYYESEEGPFVRADVTYLQQDFSVMQFVEKSGEWPNVQRFDYLIRQRELSEDEVKRLPQTEKIEKETPRYPQREAVLWALHELTGKDIGARTEDWNQYIKSMKTERMKCDP